jgi:hypothetical protein
MEYNASEKYRNTLTSNMKELENIYNDLRLDLRSLRTDARKVKLYSRELGFFEDDEYVMKIQGLDRQKIFYKVGTVLKRNTEKQKQTNLIFIGIGSGVFLVLFLFFLVSCNSGSTDQRMW